MEVIGGVSSIIALIEATGKLAAATKNLALRWNNVPYEIQTLSNRLSLLAAELQSIRTAAAKSHPILTDVVICQNLSELLAEVQNHLSALETLHSRLQRHGPARQKVQWAVKDAAAADATLAEIRKVEQSLASLMTFITWRAQTPLLDGIDRIEQMLSMIAITLPVSTPALAIPSLPPVASSHLNPPSAHRAIGKRVFASNWESDKRWQSWGLRGSLVTSKQGPHTDYSIGFTVSLPGAWILGSHILSGQLSLRSTPLYRNAFTIRHPSYLAVARIVDEDHRFIRACTQDDSATVKSMLLSGEGRPTDTTAEGYTPMGLAVLHGSTNALVELLESGVEIDAQEGEFGDTALAYACRFKRLDISRLLLQYSASPDHLDVHGSSPGMCCWEPFETIDCSPLDLWNLLRENTELDLNAVNKWGQTAIHHAAFFGGKGSLIDEMVCLGGDIHSVDRAGFKAIHRAALTGNRKAFTALLDHCLASQNSVDHDLLHAIITGRHAIMGRRIHGSEDDGSWDVRRSEYEAILEDLLRLGADPKANAWWPWYKELATSDIIDRAVTAHELAAAIDPAIEAWYLSVLQRCGFLDNEQDIQRLHDLGEAGHITGGRISECDSVPDEQGTGDGTDRETNDGDSIEPDDRTNGGDDEQFWDAEERVWPSVQF